MADDLDAFFDEVSAAEEEAKHDSKDEGHSEANDDKHAGKPALVVAKETKKEAKEEDRPAKRLKLSSAVGAVVVSKPAVVVAAKPAIVAAAQPTIAVSKPPTTTSAGASAVTTIRPTGPAPPPLPPGPPPPPPRRPMVSIGPPIGPSFPPIGPSAMIPPPPPPPGAPGQMGGQAAYKRSAAGKAWEDPSLAEFPENDFRLFVGNLAKDIREDQLADAFRSRYPSYAMSRICRNKEDGKSRGYGFVSLMDPKDLARALREMDQTWLGSRPIKVKKSEWKDRDLKEVRKKKRHEKRRNKRHLY